MSLLPMLITLLIIGMIFAVIWWGITQIPLPTPFAMIARVIFVLAVVIVLISLLTGGLGEFGFGHFGTLGNCR